MNHKFFAITAGEIFEESLKRCVDFCEIQVDTVRGKKIMQKCMETYERFCKDCIVKMIVMPFESDCIQNDAFIINGRAIHCSELAHMKPMKIIGGYAFAVFVEPLDYSMMSTVEMYYADCWLSAYVDAAWNGIKSLLLKEANQDYPEGAREGEIGISSSFGPGYNGMNMACIKDLFELMNLSEYGLVLEDDRIIVPLKSIIGIYLIQQLNKH